MAFASAADPNQQCLALESAFPYQRSVASYFSVQDHLTPEYIVAPNTTQHVSQTVGLLSEGYYQFATRSGRHGLLVRSLNVAGDVTANMTSMNSVTLGVDKTVASVQPGATWI